MGTSRNLRRAAASVAVALAASALVVTSSASPAAAAPVAVPAPAIRITEFSYQLRDFVTEHEFVELTNVGTTPVNMTGWSFDDLDAVVGQFSLSGFGVVAPGESVIFTSATAEAFRTYFSLPGTVQVIGGSTEGLGNGDQINIWDDAGVLVDRLTYDDTPRSRDNTVVPMAVADLGANVYDNWELSSAANDPGSVTVDQVVGAPTSIGSPGTSEYAGAALAGPVVPIRISEFSYQLQDFVTDHEFVELTNVGTTAVNLDGWTFGDSTIATPTSLGAFSLSGLGVVAPGESVVFTSATAEAFRDYFDLCSAVKVVGVSVPGLGNGDTIKIWDDAANLVDRVTYDDTPRSRNNSVVPNAAAVLAADDYDNWELSTAANDPGSVTVDKAVNVETSIASPATSEYATVPFTPACPPPPTPGGIDLTTYGIVGRHPLPTHLDTPSPPSGSELATEVSSITYNWDTDSLFVVGDEGTSVVQVSKTGQLIDSMTLSAGQFEDTEGLSYLGGGEFVLAEERLRQVVKFTYEGGGVLEDAETQAVKIGTTIGNIGLEGISYDPLSSGPSDLGFIGVKESGPLGLFQTDIDFGAGTASNGSPSTENSTNLFDPSLVGTGDLSDVFPISLLPGVESGTSPNLLVISQESGRIVNVNRSGAISSQLNIVDAAAPLAVPAQTMEGVTVDRDGVMYTTSEGGGGDSTHPQLLVWAPDASPLARLAVTEVAPWGSDASYAADWFELTNTGDTTLDLTGVKIDDSSNAAGSAVALSGVPELSPGESAVFFEKADAADAAAVATAFELAWFGAAGAPAAFNIGFYTGSSLGLSSSGDAVNIFAANDARLTGVSFGTATNNVTFDNYARLGAVAAPVGIGILASEGIQGAFEADDELEVGSPGNVEPPIDPPTGDASTIKITEIAPWGSGTGNSPYLADWIEVTNTGTESVGLSGWKVDDSSAAFGTAVELVGVPVLPAGKSAIFYEGTDDAAFELAFAQGWFGQNTFDAGFFFGHYTGGSTGLSTSGDAVVLFDSTGATVTGVSFGASDATSPFSSFDNAARLGSTGAPFPVVSTLSVAGTNGAFLAVDGHGVGSPGFSPPAVSEGVSGTVTEAGSGDPVGGVFVAVLRTADFSLAGSAIADAAGMYTATVAPGSYFVYQVDPTGLHQTGFLGAPTLVEVTAGAVEVLDAEISPTRGVVAGTVTEAVSGDPIEGAWAMSLSTEVGRTGALELLSTASASGEYSLDRLRPGDHFVGFADPSGAHAPRFHPNAPNVPESSTVAVTAGAATAVDGVLPPQEVTGTGATLSGVVTESGSGDPLAGVHVVVLRASDFRMARGAVTDAAGVWSVDVAAGSYHLGFTDSTASHDMEWFDGQPSTGLGGSTTVTAPGTADAALNRSVGALGGTVTDEVSGDPIGQVWVVVIGPNGIEGGVATAADGSYQIDGLAPGTYHLTFADPIGGRLQEYWDGGASIDDAHPLVVTAATTTTADAALGLGV